MKLIGIILATTGFWKLIEVLITYKSNGRLQKAQTSNVMAQANTQVTGNWIAWSSKMESRVKELEDKNTELRSIIGKQRTRITDLEKHVEKLEKVNRDLNNKHE